MFRKDLLMLFLTGDLKQVKNKPFKTPREKEEQKTVSKNALRQKGKINEQSVCLEDRSERS
jgi:hypothetical protein